MILHSYWKDADDTDLRDFTASYEQRAVHELVQLWLSNYPNPE